MLISEEKDCMTEEEILLSVFMWQPQTDNNLYIVSGLKRPKAEFFLA